MQGHCVHRYLSPVTIVNWCWVMFGSSSVMCQHPDLQQLWIISQLVTFVDDSLVRCVHTLSNVEGLSSLPMLLPCHTWKCALHALSAGSWLMSDSKNKALWPSCGGPKYSLKVARGPPSGVLLGALTALLLGLDPCAMGANEQGVLLSGGHRQSMEAV